MSNLDIELNERMVDILTRTANALHGGYAPPDCLHSWHDLPELVEKLRKERDEARRIACENEARHNGMMFDNPNYSDPVAIAEKRGWDCFDKEGNDGSK